MRVETQAKERGGVVMNDHLYKLNQWTHDAVLKAAATEQSLKARNVGVRSPHPGSTTHTPQDPVREVLQARQKRLHTLGNSEALIQQAREDLMKDARAEFAAVMQKLNNQRLNNCKLNAPQEEKNNQTAVLAELREDRIEQAAKADQPEKKVECPSDIYQQMLCENDAATIIAGEPH